MRTAILDVHYRPNLAHVACVVTAHPQASEAIEVLHVVHGPVEPYVPGRFFERELPALVKAIDQLPERPELLIIDGFVWLDEVNKPGLGAYLHQHYEEQIPVIGIAKNPFRSGGPAIREVVRGTSTKPLHVSAAGMDLEEACSMLSGMHGPDRIPTLLKLADQHSRQWPKHILTTDRLMLDEFREDDVPFILQLVNDPSWITHIGDRNIHSHADAIKYINLLNNSYREYGFGLYRVSLKSSSEPIGMCGLVQREHLPDPDIGFALLPQYAGQGMAFEAADAVLRYAQTELGINRILGVTSRANIRSQKLLERLGLSCDSTFQLGEEATESLLYTPHESPEGI